MSTPAILVGCRKLPEGDGDEHAVPAALAALGLPASWAAWDDPDVDFAAAEVVILRATWDYTDRRAEFLEWCSSVPGLLNPASVVRWNTDKSYLSELLGTGVPTVPTEVVAPGETPRWPRTGFVLKPAVGAGSIGAARFAAGETAAASAHLASLHETGRTALLQPYQSHVDVEGETAMVFFGGVYSHAFTKGAILRGSDVDGSGMFVPGKLGRAEPEPAFRAVAEDALDAATSLLGMLRAEVLYARVDLVRGEAGDPVVLELELTEPTLGFRVADAGAPLRFASAVRQQLA